MKIIILNLLQHPNNPISHQRLILVQSDKKELLYGKIYVRIAYSEYVPDLTSNIRRKRAVFPENICAWCNREIPEASEVFGLGAKVRENILLNDFEGTIISIELFKTDKTVPAIVTTSDSEAKRDGYDLMFMTCSQACAESLKTALSKDKELIDWSDFV